ncbi:MAG: proline dehydrogenase family protein [Thermomicrobiales bacterium]|nr:proline dehydrogenase family protein [Thermomicrobiales bacterium]
MSAANPASTPGIGSRVATTLNPVFRKGILVATNNRAVARGVRRYGMKLGASRFVAGETLDECVATLRGLNQKGLRTNTTLLGEGVKDEAMAAAVVSTYKTVLDRIAAEKLTTNVALKLTHLGLDLGEEVAYRNVETLVAHAATLGNFIRIDMEESARVDVTIRIYKRLREAGHDNVGTVLQSYLRRTQDDLTGLLPLTPNLRLVKGAYLEPTTVAFPEKMTVDAEYFSLAERMLQGCSFTAIATHDERIIDHVKTYAAKHGIGKDRFEFQMLYGIRTQLQLDLVAQGYRVLIATPYGPDWYYYLMRRLAERPANVLFFAKNLVKR